MAVFLAGSGLAAIHAQNLTPADYDQMRETLRQKLAEDRAKAAPAPAALTFTPVLSALALEAQPPAPAATLSQNYPMDLEEHPTNNHSP